MTNVIIGHCSLCGGPVVYPTVWYSTQPPEPFCSRCGAIMARPTIQMAKPFVNQIDKSNPLKELEDYYIQKDKEKIGSKL